MGFWAIYGSIFGIHCIRKSRDGHLFCTNFPIILKHFPPGVWNVSRNSSKVANNDSVCGKLFAYLAIIPAWKFGKCLTIRSDILRLCTLITSSQLFQARIGPYAGSSTLELFSYKFCVHQTHYQTNNLTNAKGKKNNKKIKYFWKILTKF